MFAILVTTVGLLGAVAVFPVASSMARKGRINDASAAAGRQAVHDFDVRGMRKFDQWWGYPTNWNFGGTLPARYQLLHGKIQNNIQKVINYPDGTAFCIDPRAIAFYEVNQPSASNAALHAQLSLFPAVQRQVINSSFGNHPNSVDPRMYRVSLAAVPGGPGFMGQLQADSIFTFDDDLAYDRPDEDRSQPAVQLFDFVNGNALGKRLSEGHLSWMATLVPKTELVQQFLTGSTTNMIAQRTDEYVLSIVVYYDRTFDPTQIDFRNERMVAGTFSDGVTGGEITLTDNDPQMLKLRPGDWVLAAGVQTYVNQAPPGPQLSNVPVFQWYRVSDCDAEPEFNNTTNTYQLYATLIGQDWNFLSVVNPRLGFGFQGSAQITIVQNVVAVYEKTVRLEY